MTMAGAAVGMTVVVSVVVIVVVTKTVWLGIVEVLVIILAPTL